MRFAATSTTWKRWALPIATGGLLALAYPPFNLGQLAWVALLPLLFSLENCALGDAFRRGYVAGLAFFGATLWWTIYTTEGGAPLSAALLGTVSLVAVLALYFGAAAVWFAFCARLKSSPNVPAGSPLHYLAFAVSGAAGWVTLEWVRGWFLFGGFGWNGLGVSQHQVAPLIQIASVTGVCGVSALVCFANCAMYLTFGRIGREIRDPALPRRLSWELYIAMALVCGALAFGARKTLNQSPSGIARTLLRLALVQGNVPQTLKWDPQQKPMILERYRSLTERILPMKPDLIIWPESATPEMLRYDPDSLALATNLAVRADAWLLTGTLDATPYSSPVEAFNAAMLVRPDGSLGPIYHKTHLVPFGEYVPLRKVFPLIKRLTPIPGSFERGTDFTVFELDGRASARPPEDDAASRKPGPPNGPTSEKRSIPNYVLRFGVVICFEDTVPELYRRFVQRDVDFMVNVTNDGWFKSSPAAEMHLANAVFRAVETGRPLVRCTNNGVTCVVDEHGVIAPTRRLAPFAEGALVCELSLPHSSAQTFYTQYGNWFVAACVIAVAVAIGARFSGARRR